MISQTLGSLARERGHQHERDAVSLLAGQWKKRPDWLGESRLATREEDEAGIDLVVASDVGALFLQIKSSNGGRRHFERTRRRFLVEVVVAPHSCPGLFRARLVDALTDLRRRVLAKRRERER